MKSVAVFLVLFTLVATTFATPLTGDQISVWCMWCGSEDSTQRCKASAIACMEGRAAGTLDSDNYHWCVDNCHCKFQYYIPSSGDDKQVPQVNCSGMSFK